MTEEVRLKTFEEFCRLLDGKYYEVVDPDLNLYGSHCEFAEFDNLVSRIDELVELIEDELPEIGRSR